MYPKYKIQQVIRHYGPKFIKQLKLKGWAIRFHVLNKDDKSLKAWKFSSWERKDTCGISAISPLSKSADVIIFPHNCISRKDAIGTVLHELLHIKTSVLLQCCTIREYIAHKYEEQIVRDLEEMIIAILRK